MSHFKCRHFESETIFWAVRWHCRYGISYRDLEQMMGERGVPVDHSTNYRLGLEVRAGDRKAAALAVTSPASDELAGRMRLT